MQSCDTVVTDKLYICRCRWNVGSTAYGGYRCHQGMPACRYPSHCHHWRQQGESEDYDFLYLAGYQLQLSEVLFSSPTVVERTSTFNCTITAAHQNYSLN